MQMRIRKKKILDWVKQRMEQFAEKLNKLYLAIAVMILFEIVLLAVSCLLPNQDMKNITIGLGTGVITSSLVTLYIEIINSQIQRKKVIKYKEMLLNPLFGAIKSSYTQAIIRINEYRVREQKGKNLLLPMADTTELLGFLNEMKKIDLSSIEDEKTRKRLKEFSDVKPVYFREVISQYKGIPFESLILDNIITQEEYDKLKRFILVDECEKILNTLNGENLSEQEQYYLRVLLLQGMLLLINRFLKIFDFIAGKIEYENKWIKLHLDEVYYNEVYVVSEEYTRNLYENAKAEAEYYAEHLELWEDDEAEESEEEQLYRKIDDAIWAGDEKTIIECFPQIDKNNKQIQEELTGDLAKDVMKNKELRRLYLEKYGVKYKARKERSFLACFK